MQGKGAGPVNRVELESQVLCAALRQSCHIQDKIGAFTSVRELSHLFPDLLPPSEKDDEASSVNKDNFYIILRVKPQTAANGVLSAYLRAIRRFLRSHKVAEKRTDFNRILNAGFILRKPRLRLSHDLVVARRWLHEESRMAQVAQQEITTDNVPACQPAEVQPAVSPAASAPPLLKPAAAGPPPPPPLPAAAASSGTAPAKAADPAASSGGPTAPPLPASGPIPPPLPAADSQGSAPSPATATTTTSSSSSSSSSSSGGPTAPPLPESGPMAPPLPAADLHGSWPATEAAPASAGPTPPPSPVAAPVPAQSAPTTEPKPPSPPPAPPSPVPEITPPPPLPAAAQSPAAPAPPPLPKLSATAAVDDGFSTAPTAIPVSANAVSAHEQAQPPAAVAASLAIAGLAPPLESAGAGGDESGGIKSGAAPHAVPAVPNPNPRSLRAESFRPMGRDTLPLPPAERVAGQMPLTDEMETAVFGADESEQPMPSETASDAAGGVSTAEPVPQAVSGTALSEPAVSEPAISEPPISEPPISEPLVEPVAKYPAPPLPPPAAAPAALLLPPEPSLADLAKPAAKPASPMRDLMEFPPLDLDLPPSSSAPATAAAAPAAAPAGDLMDFPPAAVRAQAAAVVPKPPPKDRPPGRISKEATFVFDESQLRKPVPAGNEQLPMVVQLLEAAQVIGPLEVQALRAQMEFAPNIPVEKHILNAGYLSAAELASAKLGESLLQRGKISMAQFQVAFYDERFSGLRMAESLQVRGWLSVEVRNAIDEWQKKSQ